MQRRRKEIGNNGPEEKMSHCCPLESPQTPPPPPRQSPNNRLRRSSLGGVQWGHYTVWWIRVLSAAAKIIFIIFRIAPHRWRRRRGPKGRARETLLKDRTNRKQFPLLPYVCVLRGKCEWNQSLGPNLEHLYTYILLCR